MVSEHHMSERHACALVGLSRDTYRHVGQTSALNPKHPMDVTANLNGPVLGLYGAADTGIPVNTVAAMQEALKTGSKAAKASPPPLA